VKGALRSNNAERLYMDEKSTEIGEINYQKNRKVKREKLKLSFLRNKNTYYHTLMYTRNTCKMLYMLCLVF